jgi:hypothetical protein
MDMNVFRTIAVHMPVKMHAVAPQPPQYVSAETNQHDADRGLQRPRKVFGDRMTQQDRGAGEDEQRQRMAEPPCQPVLDDIANVGPAGGNARDRRDVIGLQRVLHAEQKTDPQDSEHAFPDFTSSNTRLGQGAVAARDKEPIYRDFRIDTGGEGGTLRHFGPFRMFSKKIGKSGALEGYIADYKVDHFS